MTDIKDENRLHAQSLNSCLKVKINTRLGLENKSF